MAREEEGDEPFDFFKRQPKTEKPSREKHRSAPQGPAQGDQLFDKFVGEKYQGGDARVPNPNPDPDARDRHPEVTFSTAMKDSGFRRKVHEEFERWKDKETVEAPKKRERRQKAPASPAWTKQQDELLVMARNGRVVKEVHLGGGANVSSVRTLELGGKEHRFVWKPASGEDYGLRDGIPQGTYHQREAATYNVDRLLGEGTVVPPTHSNGEGSYQAFRAGSMSFYNAEDAPTLNGEELRDHPDFNRINVLDMLMGHEDRHTGNIMFSEDPDAPGGVRFIAIDNGLVLGHPEDKESPEYHYAIEYPWDHLFTGTTEAIRDSVRDIKPELHERLKKIDHEDFVDALVSTGIKDERTLLAALVRLSALQRNRQLLQHLDLPEKNTDAMAYFLFYSGHEPQKVLKAGGRGPSLAALKKVVTKALN